MAGRRKRTGKIRKIIYSMFIILFLVVISLGKLMLDDRLIQAKAKNESVKLQLEDEKVRTEELENLKLEIKTKKFIEETAREKFGLTYDNEIVFEPEK